MVATVTELRSTSAAVDYYEKDGYYAKNDPEHRRASFWHGEAASAAGLRGHVDPKKFESVLSGHVPGTDVRLGRKRDGEHVHRPGWDITLSAPKSVSLEALVRGDRRVIRAHDQAVYETLDWIEKELLETRGWDPATRKRPRIAAHGMAVAGFRHLTSRDLDPQLHTHCILANMTRIGSGAWRSVEPTLIRRNAKLIGAYYRNELASRLVGSWVSRSHRGSSGGCRDSSSRATARTFSTRSRGEGARFSGFSMNETFLIRRRRRRWRRCTRAGARRRRALPSWCPHGGSGP